MAIADVLGLRRRVRQDNRLNQIPDVAVERSRLEAQVLDCPAFPADFQIRGALGPEVGIWCGRPNLVL